MESRTMVVGQRQENAGGYAGRCIHMRTDENYHSGKRALRHGEGGPGCDWSRQKAMHYLSRRPAGAPGLGVTPGPAAEPDSGKVSIRPAMRISAVSGSVTAIRCTTPLYGAAFW